jgi:hypothetical protein
MDNNKNQEPLQSMSMLSRLRGFLGSSTPYHREQFFNAALGVTACSTLYGFKKGEELAYHAAKREFQKSINPCARMPFRYPYRQAATLAGVGAYGAAMISVMIFSTIDHFLLKPPEKQALKVQFKEKNRP